MFHEVMWIWCSSRPVPVKYGDTVRRWVWLWVSSVILTAGCLHLFQTSPQFPNMAREWFNLRSGMNNLVLNVRNNDISPGAIVDVHDYHGGANQTFRYDSCRNVIFCQLNGYCLDAVGKRLKLITLLVCDEWQFPTGHAHSSRQMYAEGKRPVMTIKDQCNRSCPVSWPITLWISVLFFAK